MILSIENGWWWTVSERAIGQVGLWCTALFEFAGIMMSFSRRRVQQAGGS